MSGVYVIDESNNNGGITDYTAVARAGYVGVILKASEGTGFLDGSFASRARAAHSAGLVVGAYHFGHAAQDVGAQVRLFNQTVAGAGVPVAIRCADVEVQEGNPEAWTQAFCPAAGINLLYSGAWFAQSQLSQPIPGVMWWVAAYGSNQPSAPWGTEAGWQFSQSGTVPGVPGAVDVSIFSVSAWAALTNQGGSNVPAPGDWIKHIPTPDGYWHLRADGALARSPGSGWRAHAMLRNDGHVYAFPYTENGVVYQDYADLPAADRVAPPGAWITDCWLV